MAYVSPFIPDASQQDVTIENNGEWEQGSTYTISWFHYKWYTFFGGEPWAWDEEHGIYPLNLDNVSNQFRRVFISQETAEDYFIFPEQDVIWRFLTDNSQLVNPNSPNLMNTDVSSPSFPTIVELEHGVDGNDEYWKERWTITVTVSPTATEGIYPLMYYGARFVDAESGQSTGDNTGVSLERDYYPITIVGSGGSSPTPFPTPRPDSYAPDDVWNPNADNPDEPPAWTSTLSDLVTLGGGRYNQQLVVIGNKRIYYGAI